MTGHNKILDEIKGLAQRLFANLPVTAYLYGSRARGDAGTNSDWDILIVADDSISTKDDFEKFAYPFTEIGWRCGEQIIPILYTRSEWNAERDTAVYHSVHNDAIPL